jgi:phage N-6-adenine-methyltransferase
VEKMTKYEDEDFRTPQNFFDGVNDLEGPFDLDVCRSAANTKCDAYIDRKQNSLLRDWFGSVWCNPPYSDPKKWFEKAIRELDENRCSKVTFLVHLDTSTRWFHDYVLERAAAIYFVKGRLKFSGPHSDPKQSSPRASVVVVMTKRAFRTHERFFCGMDKRGQLIKNQLSLSDF